MDHEKRLTETIHVMFRIYTLITALLALLPIPIRLPALSTEMEQDTMANAVIRTRNLIGDEPVDEFAIQLTDRVLMDWLAIHDLLTLEAGRETTYRFDIITEYVREITKMVDIVHTMLMHGENPTNL